MGKYDGIPYLMVVANIPKNVMECIWESLIWWLLFQFFQNVSFGFILKHFLNNDPRLAITFAGVLLLIGAICTLFIKTENKKLSE
jgi:maltose/moltooligosaccharide transporter